MTNETKTLIDGLPIKKIGKDETLCGIPQVDEYLLKSDVVELVEKLTKWNKVEVKPLCYKSGDWDGLMSDQMLVKTKDDIILTAVAYGGRMDGFEFLDFYDMDDFEVKDVIEWKPII